MPKWSEIGVHGEAVHHSEDDRLATNLGQFLDHVLADILQSADGTSIGSGIMAW